MYNYIFFSRQFYLFVLACIKIMSFLQQKNQIQYILAGSVPSNHLNYLLHRLRGLCDHAAVDNNMFEDHEAVYTMKDRANSANTVTLRVRQSRVNPDAPYQLRYIGNSEASDKNRSATMRSCIEVDCTDKITSYLEAIGFQFDHETILRGYLFRKGPMKISVARLHKIPEQGVFSDMLTMTESYLVELTLNTPVQQDTLCDEMKAFAEHLKPITLLDKVDVKR